MVEGLDAEGQARLVARVLALRDLMVVVLANQVARLDNPEGALRRVSNALSERISKIDLEDEEMPFAEMIREEHDRLLAAVRRMLTNRPR